MTEEEIEEIYREYEEQLKEDYEEYIKEIFVGIDYLKKIGQDDRTRKTAFIDRSLREVAVQH